LIAIGCGAAYTTILLIIGLLLHDSGDAASETDFFDAYVSQARKFLGGELVVDPFRGPVYPIVLAGLYKVLSPLKAGLFETGIVLSALSAGVVVGLSYRLLVLLYSARAAMVATVLLATNPVFVRYSYTTGNDMFFLAIAMVAIYAFLRIKKLLWYELVVVGGVTALAYLTRYNGASVLLAMFVGLLFLNIWKKPWRNRWVAALIVLGAFAAVITPWSVHSKQKTGKFFYNRNYVNIALGVYSTEGDTDRFLRENPNTFNSFVDVVTYDPVKFFVGVPERAVRHVNTIVFRVIMLPVGSLALLGMLFLLIRPPDRRELAYYTFGVAYFIVIIPVFFSDRFVLFLIPVTIALAVRGLFGFAEVLKAETRVRRTVAVVLVTLLAFNLLSSVMYNKKFIRGETAGLRDLGRQFAATVEGRRGGRVVSRLPHFAYYGGLEFVRMPLVTSHEALMAFIRERNADYLFFSATAQRTRRELATLMNPNASHPGLAVVAVSPIGVLYAVDRGYRE